MKQVIYVDILVAINLFINYLLIMATSKFLSLKLSKWRMVFGEILGGIYSLYILLPPVGLALSLLIKFVMSATIVVSTFKIPNIMAFAKILTCFYIINFVFTGMMLALWCVYKPNGMAVNNGTVYFSISPTVLFVSGFITYILLKAINRIIGKRTFTKSTCEIKIFHENKISILNAMIDTGNSLTEPFSGLPVIVVEKESVQNIFSVEILSSEIQTCQKSDILKSRFRMIPYKTISGEGLLPAFKPEKITINDGMPKQAYIAICSKSDLPENFSAIVNSELID